MQHGVIEASTKGRHCEPEHAVRNLIALWVAVELAVRRYSAAPVDDAVGQVGDGLCEIDVE